MSNTVLVTENVFAKAEDVFRGDDRLNVRPVAADETSLARAVLAGMRIGAVLIGACSAAAWPHVTTASNPQRRLAAYFDFASACIGWSPVVDRTRAHLATTPR